MTMMIIVTGMPADHRHWRSASSLMMTNRVPDIAGQT
jgi:hypothetical protein